MNEMPIQSTHDAMLSGHNINGEGLLISLRVDTIVLI